MGLCPGPIEATASVAVASSNIFYDSLGTKLDVPVQDRFVILTSQLCGTKTAEADCYFFPPGLAALQECELAVYKREPQNEDDALEKLEEERVAAQEFIATAESLTEEELVLKEEYAQQDFGDWCHRDFQQFVRGLETHGCGQPMDVYTAEIQDKSAEDVEIYYKVFVKKWKTLPEHRRIAQRISEGEAKRNKRDTLECLLGKKINSVRYPMQELELDYPTTVYSEEEDRYLLCRLFHYGMQAEDMYYEGHYGIPCFPLRLVLQESDPATREYSIC